MIMHRKKSKRQNDVLIFLMDRCQGDGGADNLLEALDDIYLVVIPSFLQRVIIFLVVTRIHAYFRYCGAHWHVANTSVPSTTRNL